MTTESIPDHQLAQAECEKLFASLEIKSTCTSPIGNVKDNWPCILYHFTFTKGSVSFPVEYRLGVGHVKVKSRHLVNLGIHVERFTHDEEALFQTWERKPHAQFTNKQLWADVAAKLAKAQKVSPKPCEVFARICADGLNAQHQSFESWASELGDNPDSIKAKSIYDYCSSLFFKVSSIVPRGTVEKFSELHCRSNHTKPT